MKKHNLLTPFLDYVCTSQEARSPDWYHIMKKAGRSVLAFALCCVVCLSSFPVKAAEVGSVSGNEVMAVAEEKEGYFSVEHNGYTIYIPDEGTDYYVVFYRPDTGGYFVFASPNLMYLCKDFKTTVSSISGYVYYFANIHVSEFVDNTFVISNWQSGIFSGSCSHDFCPAIYTFKKDIIATNLIYDTEIGVDYSVLQNVNLSDDSLSFDTLESKSITYSVSPEGFTGSLTWSSDDVSVATVTDGVVTPISDGTCNITCSYTNSDGTVISDSCSVVVSLDSGEEVIDSIMLSEHSLVFNTQDPQTITSVVMPDDFTSTLTWSSDNPEVATVADGVVTPVADGTCNITCSYVNSDGTVVSDSCSVTVSMNNQDTDFDFPLYDTYEDFMASPLYVTRYENEILKKLEFYQYACAIEIALLFLLIFRKK